MKDPPEIELFYHAADQETHKSAFVTQEAQEILFHPTILERMSKLYDVLS